MNSAAQITRKSRGLEADDTTKADFQMSSPGRQKGYLPHWFNPLIAKVYSLPAAIIFHYIWLRCGKRSGKFITLTLDELAAQYPYMGRTTIWEGLHFLVMPSNNPGLVSRKIINGVYHYGIIPQDKDYSTYKFDVCVATELGVVPAIILANIGHWVRLNWKQKAEQAMHLLNEDEFTDHRAMFKEALALTFRGAAYTTTIGDWVARHDYISARTAVRGFSCLLKAGFLQKRPGKQRKTIYSLSEKLLVEYADKLLSLSEIKNSDAKSEYRHAKSEYRHAKSEQEPSTNASGESTCTFPVKAVHDKELQVIEYGDAFAPSLANARSVARSASTGVFSALRAEQQAEISKLNQPGYARLKRRSSKKRGYKRLPKPDDPEFDLYVDDLPPVEREKYLDLFR